ncbi:glycoside hydrolase family 9 protein [Ensifer sp. ENS12]|uniref:glycoside hydrolase family 9 protein n=1 Tax=Ensifer sp. ENS12 TaxID=2854774 RepID=UPI000DE59F4E|nr:glycoside hydrolase family 9 protein [Ensifer sp. ENS12]MBV7519673.1 glycoside hydrolase family 9 protein [Ensifer sp. ENS12]
MSRFGIVHAAIAALFLPGPAVATELIADGRFEKGQDTFWASDGLTLERENGRLCVEVHGGGEVWSQIVGVNGLTLVPGRIYRLSLRIAAKPARSIAVRVQRAADPWTAIAEFTTVGSPGGSPFSVEFEATEPDEAQLVLPLGGAEAGRICLDDVSLVATGAVSQAAKRATEGPVIRANQLGYFTDGPKRATFIADVKRPIDFQLLDAKDKVVGKGKTQPSGFDPTAGVETQVADFSSFATAGDGYRLVSGDWASDRFSIGDNLYDRLRVDALSWFYPQRSGIEIKAAIAGKAYARSAGHVGVAPNQGDTAVPCLDSKQAVALYGGWSCSYRLDVSGGWYDAGDHGKYAVTGALSAAQLLAAYERGRVYAAGSPVTRDGLSRIPENGNGMPDILDEARWELEFLLRMMVPDGEPLAGMVHHKVHDTTWTAPPMLPSDDPQPRALYRPSTAATLDVAAVAAQGARLFADQNPTFSARLLAAARKAWMAANANPALLAPKSDGLGGGGDYDDDSISDELFWAATELYLTTGDEAYLDVLRASPLWAADTLSPAGAFDWRNVAGFARLQLALYGTGLPDDERELIRNAVLAAARHFLSVQQTEPFGLVYRPEGRRYDWGSNQLMLQNIIVLSAAFDLSGEKSFLDGAREGMDYILGRNAMALSYVTGYGTRAPKNQHSRWYAHQRDPQLPNPPVGSLAGGPNSTFVDDVARQHLKGCAPQTCYADDIEAYGSNEIAINWNAPLVYVASFLADAR